MGRLDMSDREFSLYQSMILESVKLRGQDAYIYPVGTEVEDLYSDKDRTYEERREVGVLFEANPRPILKKMNWLIEDEELPYVVYVVAKDFNKDSLDICEGMLVEILHKRGIKATKIFEISRVRGVTIDPLVWMCKLVPHRGTVDFMPEEEGVQEALVDRKSDTGYRYLKR